MDGSETARVTGLLDLAHDAIFLRDMAGRITFWNKGCEALYGWSPAEAAGRPMAAIPATSLGTLAEAAEAELLATGRWEGEVTRTCRDGTEVIVAVRLALRRDEAGDPAEVLETGRDVTASRRSEEVLRRTEYRYRNMFRAMAVSFWELDFAAVGGMLRDLRKQGVTDMRAYIAANPDFVRRAMDATGVIDVNEKTVQLFGAASKADFAGSVTRFWPRSSYHVYAGSLCAAVEGKPHFEAETKLATLDGREIDTLFTTCYPRDDTGRGGVIVLVGVVDISERVRAHDELARVQGELAHAARVSTLGELSASIAHEVNQPLAAVVTNGEAALRWLRRAEPDLGEAQDAIGRIIHEGRRASDIIARIRAMSAKKAPEQAELDCAALIEDSVLLVRREMQAHDIALNLDLADRLPRIRADRVQLQQVLVNLMINAIQAMGQSPRSGRDLGLRALAEGEGIRIEVRDSGPGITPENAARLFHAFFTTKAAGMGMGLSICKSIVEAHGGRIWAEPAPASGAVFCVTLPAIAR